jgi:aminopeptidase-like protein
MRSLTGKGNVETLKFLRCQLPDLKISWFKSNKKVFDWRVPKVWELKEAYLKKVNGPYIIDFKTNNLHAVGYSRSIDKELELSHLQNYLYSRPDLPDAIPYVTSYYAENRGLALTQSMREKLTPGKYKIKIRSSLKNGRMHYGEVYLKGRSRKEILFSTYICHPQMANNELSGPVVVTALMDFIKKMYPDSQYSYRALFLPETIGSISYLQKNFERMKSNIVAGWVVTCVGDEGKFSYIPSRYGQNLADKVTQRILNLNFGPENYNTYSFLSRGSDERQYCSPLIDLPFASITKSKYGEYDEYHTSLDDLNFISAKGLQESLDLYKKIVDDFENNERYVSTKKCEPFMQKYDLYPAISVVNKSNSARQLLDVLAYCDGSNTKEELQKICKISSEKLNEILNTLREKELIST